MTSIKLTDSLMEKYLKAYAGLQKAGIAQGNGQVNQNTSGELEQIVKKAGFTSFLEFMQVQQKVGQAISILESESYMTKMEAMSDVNDPQWAEMKKMLDDPDIPEESKKQAREQFAKSRENYDKNKKIAMPVLNVVKGMTDKDSLEVAKRYHKRILKLYTGQ